MFRCSIHVENADFKRITIKVEESNSPVCISAPLALPRYGKRVLSCDVDIPVSTTSTPSKQAKQKRKKKLWKNLTQVEACAQRLMREKVQEHAFPRPRLQLLTAANSSSLLWKNTLKNKEIPLNE